MKSKMTVAATSLPTSLHSGTYAASADATVSIFFDAVSAEHVNLADDISGPSAGSARTSSGPIFTGSGFTVERYHFGSQMRLFL